MQLQLVWLYVSLRLCGVAAVQVAEKVISGDRRV